MSESLAYSESCKYVASVSFTIKTWKTNLQGKHPDETCGVRHMGNCKCKPFFVVPTAREPYRQLT